MRVAAVPGIELNRGRKRPERKAQAAGGSGRAKQNRKWIHHIAKGRGKGDPEVKSDFFAQANSS